MLITFLAGFAAAFALIAILGQAKLIARFLRNVAQLANLTADAIETPRKRKPVTEISSAEPEIEAVATVESEVISALQNLGKTKKAAREIAQVAITAAGASASLPAVLSIALKTASLRKVA